MLCPFCGTDNASSAVLCTTCHQPIRQQGAVAGTEVQGSILQPSNPEPARVTGQEQAAASLEEARGKLRLATQRKKLSLWAAVLIGLFQWTGTVGVFVSGVVIRRMYLLVLLWLLVLWWIVHARRSLTRSQNEQYALEEAGGNVTTRSRDRAWRRGLWGLIIAAFALFTLSGVRVGHELRPVANYEILTKNLRALVAELNQYRLEMDEASERDVSSMSDYVKQCRDVEAILDKAQPAKDKFFNLTQLMAKREPFNPWAQKLSATMQTIYSKDGELCAELRKEIEKAKILEKLPPSEQKKFYDENILSIEKNIERLRNEARGLMREVEELNEQIEK